MTAAVIKPPNLIAEAGRGLVGINKEEWVKKLPEITFRMGLR